MPYLNRKSYRRDRPVLYNNCNTNNLYGSYIDPSQISKVGGYRRVIEGSWLTQLGRVLARSLVIAPYVSGDAAVVVSNPWAFLPGDVLFQIGDETVNALSEKNAVANATQEFGTVVSVDAGVNPQKTTLTIAAVAVDDVLSVKLGEVEVSYTAVSTDIGEAAKGLYDEFTLHLNQSHFSTIDRVEFDFTATELVITAKNVGEIFSTTAIVSGSATIDVAVTPGIGTLVITPAAGNTDQNIGAKIGVIDQPVAGIIASSLYLTDESGSDRVGDYAAYDTANINRKALTYLDGDLVSALPTLKFMPPYV